MSNKPRTCEPNLTYHTKSRCIDLLDMMEDAVVKKMLVAAMKEARQKYNFKYISYQIMDNHFHFIIQTVEGGPTISRIMQYIKSHIAVRYNQLAGRTGPFWNERYSDIIVEEQENPIQYLFWLIWHMAYNAVKAGKCCNPRNYPYSSITSYLEKEVYAPLKIDHHHYFIELGESFTERVTKFLEYEEAYHKRFALMF